MTGSKWISSMSIHPGGDNLLVGTFDKKVLWFDLDLSSLPYQTLRFHTNALRSVEYHKRYPLFASAGDDRAITVSHGMVYSDLLQECLVNLSFQRKYFLSKIMFQKNIFSNVVNS